MMEEPLADARLKKIVEQVAIALCHHNFGSLSLADDAAQKRWDVTSPMAREFWREEAHVAIDAFLQANGVSGSTK